MIVFLCFVFVAWSAYWLIKRKYLPTEKTEGAVSNEKKKWFAGMSVPSSVKGFGWGGLVVRLLMITALNILVFHFNPMSIWTNIYGDIGQTGLSSWWIINITLVIAALLASFPTKEEGGAGKAAKWLSRIAVGIVVAFLLSTTLTTASQSSTTVVNCPKGEWSAPYTFTTNNICWDTTEDVYRVRVNKDPKMVYGTNNGGKLGIPSRPRVHTVEFMFPEESGTVTVKKKM